ncbi:MAG: hypothetical protein KBA71_09535 [Opitutaceae bacterium]|nr:hypothetical protein [Opitutaceae bacterium]
MKPFLMNVLSRDTLRLGSLALVILLGATACSKETVAAGTAVAGPKEVTRAVAAEAEALVAEAAFALQLKDYPRVVETLTKATRLRDDIPEWWVDLGATQRRLNNLGEAKSCYKKALAIHESRYDQTKNVANLIPQFHILLLLDREKDARSLLEKSQQRHASDPQLKEFIAARGIDALLEDPYVKENKI